MSENYENEKAGKTKAISSTVLKAHFFLLFSLSGCTLKQPDLFIRIGVF